MKFLLYPPIAQATGQNPGMGATGACGLLPDVTRDIIEAQVVGSGLRLPRLPTVPQSSVDTHRLILPMPGIGKQVAVCQDALT